MAARGCAARSRFLISAFLLGLALCMLVPAAQAAEHQLLASDAAVNDQLGTSVAVDGDVAVVGAPHDNLDHGAAYVYVKTGGVWTEAAKLVASDGANPDQFGTSVAIKGDVVAVGAPSRNVGVGAAYVFVKPVTGWNAPAATPMTENAKLTVSGAAAVRGFGFSIDVGGTGGDVVVVGAPNESQSRGALYVFLRPGANWTGSLNENAKLAAPDAAPGDLLGASCAVNGDATIVVGGALSDDTFRGSVRLFLRPSGGWSGTIGDSAKLIAGDGTPNDFLGTSTDISGETVASGARGDDSQRGSAYVFLPPSGGWAGIVPNVAKLVASEGTPGDEFGFAIAIDGTRVVVGAPLDDLGGDSVYVYDRPPTGWAGTVFESSKFVSTATQRGDRLGHSVGISGNVAIAGAPMRDEARGAAVVWDLPPTAVTVRLVSARRAARGVLVRWQTGAEVGAVGFNVYRERAGKRVRINHAIVHAGGGHQWRAYSFLDRNARKGLVRYWVQSLNLDGARAWHGPALVR